jgi:hypothetical protein
MDVDQGKWGGRLAASRDVTGSRYNENIPLDFDGIIDGRGL